MLGHQEIFEAQGEHCKVRPLALEVSRRDKKPGNLRVLNLEVLLDPCELLLAEGSFNAS